MATRELPLTLLVAVATALRAHHGDDALVRAILTDLAASLRHPATGTPLGEGLPERPGSLAQHVQARAKREFPRWASPNEAPAEPVDEQTSASQTRACSSLRSSTPLNRLGLTSELVGSRLNRVSDTWEDVLGRLRQASDTWEDVLGKLPQASDIAGVVVTPEGPVRAVDLVNLVIAELVASHLAVGGEPTKQALASASRTLAAVLAERHPGRTIEVRVPPATAVQIRFDQGPTHTRGTPPNVIETDPATFIRLAAGITLWPEALAAGTVTASGAAADLSPGLPLIRPIV